MFLRIIPIFGELLEQVVAANPFLQRLRGVVPGVFLGRASSSQSGLDVSVFGAGAARRGSEASCKGNPSGFRRSTRALTAQAVSRSLVERSGNQVSETMPTTRLRSVSSTAEPLIPQLIWLEVNCTGSH